MQYLTLKQVRDKVLREHDLLEETFITPDEIDSYIREAIDMAESYIISLYEDYYLADTDWLTIATKVDLPSDIYANKLRKVVARNNSNDDIGFQLFKNTHLNQCKVGYNIYHKSSENPQLVFENLGTDITQYKLIYTRNANRPTADSDIIDVPEVAVYFVTQYVKVRCYEKERDPLADRALGELQQIKQSMIDALSNIVDDGSEIFKTELDFYDDFDSNYFY